jgi:hypothetical protein
MNVKTSIVALFAVSAAACSGSEETIDAPADGAQAVESTNVALDVGTHVQSLPFSNGFDPLAAPGCATAIAYSSSALWILGCDSPSAGNHGIYKYEGGAWRQVAGAAKSIAVSPEGTPWVVNAAGEIYRWNGSAFARLPGVQGCATAIAVGANNSAWVLGCDNPSAGNHGIYRFNGSSWQVVPGAAKAIAVAPNGAPWVVNAAGEIYRWNGLGFQGLGAPGCAREIGVGSNDIAYAIGCNSLGGGNYGVYGWNGHGWESVPGAAVRVSVSGAGVPAVVNASGTVFIARL